MSIEQIKNAITFETHTSKGGLVTLRGGLRICAECFISPCELHAATGQMEVQKQRIRQKILDVLYEDQNREFAAALNELVQLDPMDNACYAAQAHAMLAARFQRPTK